MRYAMLVVIMLVFVPATVAADDPPKPLPEMKILEEMIGTWDEVVTNKETEWMPKATRSTTVTKKSWTLGGKFLKSEGMFEPAKTEFVALMSYDPGAKVYRSWYFDASGVMPRGMMRGTFDDKTRTLTWNETDEAGNKGVCKHKLVDKDNLEWTLVITNPEGKVVLDMAGKCKRK